MPSRFLSLIFLAVLLALFILVGGARFFSPWRSRIAGSVTPILSSFSSLADKLRTLLGGPTAEKVRALEEERVRLLAEVARRDGMADENAILREALALRREGVEGAIPARVIGFFREGRDEFLIINRGVESGVASGDIVLNRARVFGGQVVDSGSGFARVALASSPSRSVDVSVSDKLRAVARGNNSRELVIERVPRDAEVKSGDLVRVSSRSVSGQDSFLIGEVREVHQAENEVFKTVRAVHLFDPAEDSALILLAP